MKSWHIYAWVFIFIYSVYSTFLTTHNQRVGYRLISSFELWCLTTTRTRQAYWSYLMPSMFVSSVILKGIIILILIRSRDWYRINPIAHDSLKPYLLTYLNYITFGLSDYLCARFWHHGLFANVMKRASSHMCAGSVATWIVGHWPERDFCAVVWMVSWTTAYIADKSRSFQFNRVQSSYGLLHFWDNSWVNGDIQ